MLIREKLLSTGYIEDTDALTKYIEIVSKEETQALLTEKHHIVPVSYFKLTNQEIDNSAENIVKLSIYNHLLAHYYLYNCAKTGALKSRLALAFVRMKSGQQSHLLTLDEASFIEALPRYAELIEGNHGSRIIYTDEVRRNISAGQKKRDPSTFKGPEMTLERRQHLRELNLGKKQSEETKQKRREALHKLQWFTNGVEDVRAKVCPEGFYVGRTYKMTTETKSRCSQTGKKWFNNGIKNTMAVECPEGFVPGRMK